MITTQYEEVKQMSIDLDARVEDAVDVGLEAFWAAIVEKFASTPFTTSRKQGLSQLA